MRSAAIQIKKDLSKYDKANMKLILFIFNCFDLLKFGCRQATKCEIVQNIRISRYHTDWHGNVLFLHLFFHISTSPAISKLLGDLRILNLIPIISTDLSRSLRIFKSPEIRCVTFESQDQSFPAHFESKKRDTFESLWGDFSENRSEIRPQTAGTLGIRCQIKGDFTLLNFKRWNFPT